MSKKRIFIGPIEIAGYNSNLAKAFKNIGEECDYITYSLHPFEYEGKSKSNFLLYTVKHLTKLSHKPNSYYPLRKFTALLREITTSILAIITIIKYDVFIFSFGESLLRNNLDLILLKLLRKKIISNLGMGSEARLPYIDGSYQSKDALYQPSLTTLLTLTKHKKSKLSRIEIYSTVIIGAPFSTPHLLKNKMINWFCLGIPFQSQAKILHSPSKNKTSRCVHILHSPSHPALKGTKEIQQAIENLKKKGYIIEFVLLHGKSNEEVIHEIQKCDFVVDQLYSDTPMAVFSTEAAWFGKPSIVGGYGFDYLKTLIPDEMWPPSKTCHPDAIEQAIEYLILNHEERLQLGAKAYKFVHDKWNIVEIARRYLRLIEGDIPEDWWLDPNTITYLEGCGQPIERTKENIRQLVKNYGIESLQLSHRPDLERAFLDFSGIQAPVHA